jgi:hypothetical protein
MLTEDAMRFYKITLSDHSGESAGYDYAGSKLEVRQILSALAADTYKWEVTPIEVEPTKKGILAALKRHGSHNDNG